MTKGERQSAHGGEAIISRAPNISFPVGVAGAGMCEARQDLEILKDTGRCVLARIPYGNGAQALLTVVWYC